LVGFASGSDFQFLKKKQQENNHNKISSKTKTINNLQKIQQTPPFSFSWRLFYNHLMFSWCYFGADELSAPK
jgi:hypothetical protein